MDDRRQMSGSPTACNSCGSSNISKQPLTVRGRTVELLLCLDCERVDRRWYERPVGEAAHRGGADS